MLLRKENAWIALGLKKVGRDLAGDLYVLVSRTIHPNEIEPPRLLTEAMSKEGATRAGIQHAKAMQEAMGYGVAELSLYEDAFAGSIDPFAGIEPLPMGEIKKAIEKDKFRRALVQAQQLKALEAETEAKVAKAKAEAAEAEAVRLHQTARANRYRSQQNTAQPLGAINLPETGREPWPQPREAPPTPATPKLELPKEKETETPDAARRAGVDYEDLKKRFGGLELD